MKKIIAAIFIIFFSGNAMPQTGWNKIFNAGAPLNSVHFINELTGVVCGDFGTLMKTTNGGINWTALNCGITGSISDAVMLSPLIIVVSSGTEETIVRSINGGMDWTYIVSTASSNKISNFSFPSDSIGYACTDSRNYNILSRILKTTDRGASWLPKQIYTCGSWAEFYDNQTGWICSQSNAIGLSLNFKKTINGASGWEAGYFISTPTEVKSKLFIKNSSEIYWSWQSERSLLRSNNSVTDWTFVTLPSSPMVNTMKFIDSQTGWLAGSEGVIGKTTNGGTNWTTHSNGNFSFTKIFFVNNTGWLISTAGDIFKTTNGTLTTVETAGNSVPEQYSLSQNYPNPFNPSTRINYELKISDYVSLKVFDLLGKEVASLVNEKQNAGSYSVDFNSAKYNIPSGIYFYTLNAGEFKETRKMILIK